ncbi:GAF and ANTAR domain-containing protein [Streptomyces sp. NPDC058685]|uniref:GAF and ANTAR domain-containing protein n=1 Tax=Streptomyces sp. NPDC058685 TaxID=3346598 RepID=UPI00364C675F
MLSPEMADILRLLHVRAEPGLPDGCTAALGMDHLAVSLVGESRTMEQLWSSGATGILFDDLQFTLGEGPASDTVRTGLLTLEHDVAAVRADRWPALMPAMAGLPIRAMFCFPLALGGITVGVLTALRATPGPMSGREMDDALALVSALTLHFLGADGTQLEAWIDAQRDGVLHRAVVHQATGMLSVQLAVPLPQALLRLRAHAYGHARSIVDVAEDIVARRLRLAPDHQEPDSTDETRG